MTLGSEPGFQEVVRKWLQQDPGAILICTIQEMLEPVQALVDELGDARISVICVARASARRQQWELVRHVKTDFLVMADDRSHWSSDTLQAVLGPFSDPTVAGVTSTQVVRPANGLQLTLWEFFGHLNLQRRNVQHSALAHFFDGQVLNLSGRLSAFRVCVFQTEGFYEHLVNSVWLGRYPMETGDDNAFTTWLLQKGWRTSFVTGDDVVVRAGVSSDSLYLRQLLRWLRDTLRYYIIDLYFSLRTCQARDVRRSVSNFVVYFITDISMVLEIFLLLHQFRLGSLPSDDGSEPVL